MRLSWRRRAECAVFFDYSGGRRRPWPRGTPRGRRKASGDGHSQKHVKTRWIRGPGAPNRMKNAYDRGTPMGSWGRIFPGGTPGRAIRAPGPPICGFGARSGGTWPDPRRGTPRSPSGRNFAPRAQGRSGRPVRAPGGRIRPESTCFPVEPGRLRDPEKPHSGPAPGAPGAAGSERATQAAPQEARGPRQPKG